MAGRVSGSGPRSERMQQRATSRVTGSQLVAKGMRYRKRHSAGAAGKVALLSGAGWLIASPAYAHPDPFTHAGALSWVLSALIGLAIVAAIWWSARR